MVAWSFPGARDAVDVGAAGLVAQRVGHQSEVDAQAEVAAERGLTVVPPAVLAGRVVEQAPNFEILCGAGSLRQAVADLCAGGTITFDAAFFATPRTINQLSALAISKSMTITGPGAAQLTIDGGADTIDGFVTSGAIDLSISKLVLTDFLNAVDAVAVGSVHEDPHHFVQMTTAFGGKRIVIFSGGEAKGTDAVLAEVRELAAGGSFGSIMGRNAFQRPRDGPTMGPKPR